MGPEIRLDQLGLDSLDRMELSLEVERQFGFSGDEACRDTRPALRPGRGACPPQAARAGAARLVVRTAPGSGRWSSAATRSRPPSSNMPWPTGKDVMVADDRMGVLTGERLLVGDPDPVPPAARNRGVERRRAAAGVGGLRRGPAGPAPGRQAAGRAQLDDGPGQPGPRGPDHGPDARRHLAGLHRPRWASSVEGAEYLFLEDLQAASASVELLRTLLLVRWRPGSVRRAVPAASPDDPAVVLFTSGSEKAPKAVPLTHANILSYQRGGRGRHGRDPRAMSSSASCRRSTASA